MATERYTTERYTLVRVARLVQAQLAGRLPDAEVLSVGTRLQLSLCFRSYSGSTTHLGPDNSKLVTSWRPFPDLPARLVDLPAPGAQAGFAPLRCRVRARANLLQS